MRIVRIHLYFIYNKVDVNNINKGEIVSEVYNIQKGRMGMRRKLVIAMNFLLALSSCIFGGCGNEHIDSIGAEKEILGVADSYDSVADGIADIVLKGGYIYTVDKNKTVAEAMAIDGDIIMYVGDNKGAEKYITKDTKVIELNGKMLMPGMYDAHAHMMWNYPDWIYAADLTGAKSLEEYQTRLKKFAEKNPDLKVIVGTGWDNICFPQTGPTKEMIDKVINNKPVVLRNANGHSSWINSKAIEELKITKDTQNPKGGYIEKDPKTGEPTGLLREDALYLADKLIPAYTLEQKEKAVLQYQDDAHAYGVVGLNEGWMDDSYIEVLNSLENKEKLGLRWSGEYWINEQNGVENKIKKVKEQALKNKGGDFQ